MKISPQRVLPFLVFISAPASALVVESTSVQAQLDAAVVVAEVRVTGWEAHADPKVHAMFTARATVTRLVSTKDDGGWLPREGDEVLLEGIGGEVEVAGRVQGIFLSGFPRPHVGKSYRAYLTRHEGHTFGIAGFESGLVPLQHSRSYSRNRTDGSNGEGDGAYLYWDEAFFPIPYYISQTSFTDFADAIPAIDASFKTWRDPQDVKVEFIPMGCSLEGRNENDGVNNVILIKKDWPFDPAAIAITRNFYIAGTSPKAGLILDSDILLNGVDHKFTTTNQTGRHDVQNIVTHEAGHFLGLGHEISPEDPDAVMFSIASPNETKKRTLHASDLEGLHAAYLGVGKKLAHYQASSPCNIPQTGVGCATAHDAPAPRAGWWWALLFLVGNVVGGRAMVGRLAMRTSKS